MRSLTLLVDILFRIQELLFVSKNHASHLRDGRGYAFIQPIRWGFRRTDFVRLQRCQLELV